MADVDSTCNVRTLLVDADGACCLQVGIGSPLRARWSIFMRNVFAHGIELRDKIRSIFLALSVQQKQDHSFAIHTKQRTLVRLFGLHASCILVSKSDRSCTALFTGFASVAPVRIETSTRELFTAEMSQHIVKQSSASCVGPRCHRRRLNRTHQGVWSCLVFQCPTQGNSSSFAPLSRP